MTKPRLHYDMIKLLAKKMREQAIPPLEEEEEDEKGVNLMGTPLLNFMFVSNHCKQAILGQFGELMTYVVYWGEKVEFWGGDNAHCQFYASPWFLAYLIRIGLLRVKDLVFTEKGVSVACKRDLGDCDLNDVSAIDMFSWLVGFEEAEPGLSACQWVDLRLEQVDVECSGHEDLDLNKFLALQPKKCEISTNPTVPILMPQRRASFPCVSEIYIANPNPCHDWTLLLSRMIDACPNLSDLTICFYHLDYDRVTQFRNEIFPRLPQETKAVVTIDYYGVLTRQEFEAISAHPLFGDFNVETDHEDLNDIFLRRAMRWERGEGMEPWRVLLTIELKEDD